MTMHGILMDTSFAKDKSLVIHKLTIIDDIDKHFINERHELRTEMTTMDGGVTYQNRIKAFKLCQTMQMYMYIS